MYGLLKRLKQTVIKNLPAFFPSTDLRVSFILSWSGTFSPQLGDLRAERRERSEAGLARAGAKAVAVRRRRSKEEWVMLRVLM